MASHLSNVLLASRLADSASLNDALEELATVYTEEFDLDALVLAQLSSIIREPKCVADIHQFASLLVEIGAEEFIPPLVEMIHGDPERKAQYTLSYMYVLGAVLDEAEYAFKHPLQFFPQAFIAQLGRWLLNTGGGEISYKAGAILFNIRVSQAFDLMRQGLTDSSLFHQTRLCCLQGLVNGVGVSELPFLSSLSSDSEPKVREAVVAAVAWLKEGKP